MYCGANDATDISLEHLYASPARTGPGRASKRFDKRTQTRRFEALVSLDKK